VEADPVLFFRIRAIEAALVRRKMKAPVPSTSLRASFQGGGKWSSRTPSPFRDDRPSRDSSNRPSSLAPRGRRFLSRTKRLIELQNERPSEPKLARWRTQTCRKKRKPSARLGSIGKLSGFFPIS